MGGLLREMNDLGRNWRCGLLYIVVEVFARENKARRSGEGETSPGHFAAIDHRVQLMEGLGRALGELVDVHEHLQIGFAPAAKCGAGNALGLCDTIEWGSAEAFERLAANIPPRHCAQANFARTVEADAAG